MYDVMKDIQDSKVIELDGSMGEGGGAILRVGAGLATSLHRPLQIVNIRANRKKPGLKPQHLIGIEALKKLTEGSSSTLEVGTTSLNFTPGNKWIPKVEVQIRTAGNIGLLSQTLQNAFVYPGIPDQEFTIKIEGGGTYGIFAPGSTYIQNVTFHIFRSLGYNCNLAIEKHGFYPKGGAKATLTIHPSDARTKGRKFITLERGKLQTLQIWVHADEQLRKPQVAERICSTLQKFLETKIPPDTTIKCHPNYHFCRSVGVGVDAWLEFDSGIRLGAGTILGKRGVSSETVAKNVFQELLILLQSEETVDVYAADQILPFLMTQKIPFSFKVRDISSHLHTNIDLLESILGERPNITKEGPYFILSSPKWKEGTI